ncbi:MAG: hypothetical protein K6A65_07070 [Succinivibrionaceae bacterium]|nr:hypothetical protein [Succinivibrionaceae bacterium]
MLTACSGKPGKEVGVGSQAVYGSQGMEISHVASDMATTMYQTMVQNLSRDTPTYNPETGLSQEIRFPTVAVTSFVDTDTYENAGHLGRALGEYFVHELNRRGVPVFELKLRKGLNVTKDGEYLYSRDWKKLSGEASVSHVLHGTITRNERGVVLVGRIDDLKNHTVIASGNGFIPYSLLPYCYRTAEKNCSLDGVRSYVDQGRLALEAQERKRIAESNARYQKKRQKDAGRYGGMDREDAYRSNDLSYATPHGGSAQGGALPPGMPRNTFEYHPEADRIPATSMGNYQRTSKSGTNPESTKVYPANSYMNNRLLVRDGKDTSQYDRARDL